MRFIITVCLLCCFALLVVCHVGCRKDGAGAAGMQFSTDTLTFDTVFTSLGSTTRYFKVYNRSSRALRIEEIRLMRLVGNQFRINVDGVQGDVFTNVEIPPRDSLYVFVEVTVNPTSAATPFVIIDDVSFVTDGQQRTVHLQAFGQNAHFHYGEEIKSGTAVWSNDLPHVIVAKDTIPGVYVRCGAALHIQPGCKIFFAGNSALFIEGTLHAVANTWSDSIVFQGARLEPYYNDKPGQWFGIVFLRNSACAPQGLFDHCVIDESKYGIYAGGSVEFTNIQQFQGASLRPQVTVRNTIVKNTQFNALQGFNALIDAENTILYAAGDNLVKLWLGGEYTFRNCTFFNTGSRYVNHQKEVLLLNNAVVDNNQTAYPQPLKTTFENCVIYGSLQNEILFANINGVNTSDFDNNFSHCLLKTRSDTLALYSNKSQQLLFNTDPRFKSPEKGNFTPSDSIGYVSPLIDASPSGLPFDIYGTPRPRRNQYDIGAVELP
ncbi:MAG: hypothetical protein NZM35_00245 [Chitinophagales bacterium]|nr:hypothetical protein [Chitinophagales bacterium]MDW8417875.1 hypothetical protein [Chitinophagales bacterium]